MTHLGQKMLLIVERKKFTFIKNNLKYFFLRKLNVLFSLIARKRK